MIRRTVHLVVLALLGPALAGPAAAQTEPLGRLFFTPEKRAALERQRQLNIQEAQTLEGATMSLDGVVLRSTGKRTVWVNNQAQHDKAMPTGVAADLSARQPGRAKLRAGEETPAELKVGEAINRATRETASGLGTGRVSVHRPAAPAKK